MRSILTHEGFERRKRMISALTSAVFHVLLLLLLSLLLFIPEKTEMIELQWGGVGGGQGENPAFAKETPAPQKEVVEKTRRSEKEKVDLPDVTNPSDVSLPAPKKKVVKKPVPPREKVLTTERTRSRIRPTGAGRGSGGGIGSSQGYSIDWGGMNSRKLLSGRIPVYPEGTDKEMPVVLQFTVLPDGSVANVLPARRSDEVLEREAISALRTWRFDPLPPQFDQKSQTGTVTFNFKLE